MIRASGKRAALAAILLAIALGFGGALANLQPADARADYAPSASAALAGAQPSAALTDARPDAGAAPIASVAAPSASAALSEAQPGGGAGAAGASGRIAPPTTPPQPPAAAQTNVDYDDDDDDLIDVRSLAQLQAVRWDKNGDGSADNASDATNYSTAYPNAATGMGCPGGSCSGYELRVHLDLDTNGDGSVGTGDAYTSWDPLPDYASTLKGNGFTISNLLNTSGGRQGLFNTTKSGFRAEGIGVINPVFTGSRVGAFVGHMESGGTIVACWAQGGTITGQHAGGIAGVINDAITSSYSSASVASSGNQAQIGGLVGLNDGGAIRNSYSYGAVTSTATGSSAGTGGLVGSLGGVSPSPVVSNSYFNAAASGQTNGAGRRSTGVPASVGTNANTSRTASQLQTPTGYTGIYGSWNANIDGVTGNDDPWDFGTSSQYPILKYNDHNAIIQRGDYDSDDDNLIDIKTLDQLNAVRWDLNGDGAFNSGVTAANKVHSKQAWLRGPDNISCHGTCVGYELMNDLDFDTDDSGVIDSSDDYPTFEPLSPFNSGLTSQGAYTATFKGNNRVISNLTASAGISRVGLFGGVTGTITGVGLSNVDISQNSNSCCGYVGALAAYLHGGGAVRSSWATGSVSSSTTGANTAMYAGGLVGYVLNATVAASWADVAVSASTSTALTGVRGYSGGLVGNLAGDSTTPGGAIIASYALGSVSSNVTAASNARAGGLVGNATSAGGSAWTIAASYSAGPVTSNGTAGGLIGVSGGTGTATAAYWDTTTSGIADDNDNNMPEGRTPRQLQQPRPYTGIYSDWNVDVDNADTDDSLTSGRDDPWEFGAGMQHPMLKWGGMELVRQGYLTMGAADADTNGEAPRVGRMSRVCLTTGPVLRAPRSGSPSLPARWVWQWSSTWSQDDADWTDIAEDGGGTYEYTPVSGDSGRHLRACVDIKSDDARSEGMDRVCTRPFAAVQ